MTRSATLKMVVPVAAAVVSALIHAAYTVLLRDAEGIDMLALAWYSGIVSFAIGIPAAAWMWYTGAGFHWVFAASGFLAGWIGAVMYFAFVRDETKSAG